MEYLSYKQIAATRLKTRDGPSFLRADRRYAAQNPGWNIVPTNRSPLLGSKPGMKYRSCEQIAATRLKTRDGISFLQADSRSAVDKPFRRTR
jgi:uncharacterized C2H2 Zn-finger protein